MVVVVVALIAGCRNEQPIDDWLADADVACHQAQAGADANPGPQSPLPGESLRRTAKHIEDEVDQLRQLAPPSERRAAVSEYLITLGHRVEILRNYGDALDKAPAQGPLPSRVRLEEITTQAYTQAVALGMEDCDGGVDFAIDTTTTTLVPGPAESSPVPTAIGGQPENEDTTQDR
jgi:hypothetical protein